MIKNISKNTNGLKGEIIIPSDKSISHRAIMLCSLAKGKSIIKNFSSGVDCHSTLNIFKQLGVNIQEINKNTLEINSNGVFKAAQTGLDAGNSGTTTRLLSGILARQKFNSVIIGDESLSKRPMKRIIEPLTLMGAEIKSIDGHLPLSIRGKNLNGITYNSKISSAQVKSCVLLAGLDAQSKTEFTEPFKSRNHTELMLEYLGADIIVNGNSVSVTKSELQAKDIEIVGDISSAAFFIAAGLIVPNSDIIIKNVGINPTRTGILDIVERMNGNINILNPRLVSGELCADIRVQYSPDLKSCTIEGEDIPRLIDEIPAIAVVATQAEGDTIIKNAEDLRNKEADRISALALGLKDIGADIEEARDGFIIGGQTGLKGGVEVDSFHDHRLAMSFYVAGLICEEEIAIEGFEWTKISFPEFEFLFEKLTH